MQFDVDFTKVNYSMHLAPRVVYRNVRNSQEQKSATVTEATWRVPAGGTFLNHSQAQQTLHVVSFGGRTINHTEEATLVGFLVTHGILKEKSGLRIIQEAVPTTNENHFAYRQDCSGSLNAGLRGFDNSSKPKLILIILPTSDPSFYAEVKRWGDCEVGIPTVCIVDDNVGKLVGPKDAFRYNIG